tara:strand:+ start:382 stop:573 length:192 start_codon:yes stop_codon:yes gene_type:complete
MNYDKQMNITVKVKNNWGREDIYPVCQSAKSFARIAGTTTITKDAIELIKQLGYKVQVEQVTL